jgi:hypothetical protein
MFIFSLIHICFMSYLFGELHHYITIQCHDATIYFTRGNMLTVTPHYSFFNVDVTEKGYDHGPRDD